jgi:hypothetical protein
MFVTPSEDYSSPEGFALYQVGEKYKGPHTKYSGGDSGTMSADCFQVLAKNVEATKKDSEVIKTSYSAIAKHWIDGKDDYFVIPSRKGKEGPYTHMQVFKTTNKDPLGLDVDKFMPENIGTFYFGNYGLADIGQVRLKVAGVITGGEVEIK